MTQANKLVHDVQTDVFADAGYQGVAMRPGKRRALDKSAPMGAGLAQCEELVWQLRGQAEQRQVDGPRLAPQHNLGLGGACVVMIFLKFEGAIA